jgi:2-dehydropantoate 2-reductase
MRLLVLGAGGIGGYFGARIHAAGGDVTFLVRPARAAALRENGLKVFSPHGDLHIVPKVLTRDELREPFDALILSCKAYDLDAAMDDIAPAVGPRTLLLPLLNGVSHIDRLAARYGRERVLGGVAQAALLVTPEGDIRHFNTTHRLITGAFGETPDGLPELARLIAASGVDFILADDIEQAMWNKFVFWSALAGATCTLRANIGIILQTLGGEEFVTGLIAECARVAERAGHALTVPQLSTCRELLTESGSVLEASMLRDIERGNRTEAEFTLGDLVERARAYDINAHCLRLAYTHMQAYEIRRQSR